ncbi:MAG: CDP-diacylglycerol--glycerol-3-phosphate 3-phosphatidyltransferase [Firmicutes bacterium]|nr:CDP-diacylglycerol--glycerol-3-phosphate 3-phosphatidyltransferase [Bacillota bacterium]
MWNLPNKLTVLRIALVPVYVAVFCLVPGLVGRILALAIFAAASYTDHLDGKIARERNLITNFGKFMDPLADKMLVISAMICFVENGQMAGWILIIFVSREFIISGFRLVAAAQGIVIAAGIWGKLKTVFQMIMVMLMILHLDFTWYHVLEQIALWASVILTIISMVDYIYKNRQVLTEKEAPNA